MYDSKGQTGGCQASYTVTAASNTPTCSNVTFPASLEVEALSSSGPLSQYGWVLDFFAKVVLGTEFAWLDKVAESMH
jgi:hypothetical protein